MSTVTHQGLKRKTKDTFLKEESPNKVLRIFPQQLPRPFNILEAPTLTPSEVEFADPHAYIASLHEIGKQYGIVKIKPPPSWNPGFAIDKKTYSFGSHRQRLSGMGVVTRTSKDYARRLVRFQAMQGYQVTDMPCVPLVPNLDPATALRLANQPPSAAGIRVPYYSLHDAVACFGGPDKARVMWPQICTSLGLPAMISENVATVYYSVVLPFEQYCARAATWAADIEFDFGAMNRDCGNDPQDYPNSLAEARDRQDDECIICDETAATVACRQCSCLVHFSCLGDHALGQPDQLLWYCPHCLSIPSKFHFAEGSEYTLERFEQTAAQYYNDVLESIGATKLSEVEKRYAIETEFWRHVGDIYSHIEVDYGSELRCEDLGSGFGDPDDSDYAGHKWSLWKLPVEGPSLFKYLKTPLSGVSQPWGYAGMTFSAFCWHNEDHYAYSLNYQHLGECKTWYGVPAEFSDKFESIGKLLAPDCFHDAPDLLNERTSLVPPELLLKNGIPVYAVDQMPGEFVLTFPQVYHAGFNHGFNFNEAVNYLPPDWAPYGLQSLQKYRSRKHALTFSHEWLIYEALSHTTDPAALASLVPHFKQLIDQEINKRRRARYLASKFAAVKNVSARTIMRGIEDKSADCVECQTLPYFSRMWDVQQEQAYCLECLLEDRLDPSEYGEMELQLNHTDAVLLQAHLKARNQLDRMVSQRRRSS